MQDHPFGKDTLSKPLDLGLEFWELDAGRLFEQLEEVQDADPVGLDQGPD